MERALNILIIDSDPADRNAANRETVGHSTGEGYAAALKSIDPTVETTIVCPYGGDALPDLAPFDGVVFTGSGVDWSTEAPEAEPLRKAMRAVFAAGRPAFGSCNGMQLAASVLGGRCEAGPNGREDGLAKNIHLTPEGKTHPMMQGRLDGYAVPCVHRDEVSTLPEGAVLLAGNAHSAVQAFAIDTDDIRFWGVQYHPEYTLPFIGGRAKAWGRTAPQEAEDIAAAAHDPDAAQRLGVRFEDMQDDMRLTEIRNWLASL